MAQSREVDRFRKAIYTQLINLPVSGGVVVVGRQKVEVPVTDLVEDLSRMMDQAIYHMRRRLLWPCVLLDKTDMVEGEIVPRYVPINFERVEISADARQEFVEQLRKQGIPIAEKPINTAWDGFAEGAVDTILGRAKWVLSRKADPEVEVTTNPTGDDIRYSKGHFFSTALGFGRSDVKKRIPAATYCFYRTTEAPHTGMTLWAITADQKITL
jgi:hypothetical protein